jgi:hypothetical protein
VATSADRHRIVVSVFFAEDLRLVTRPSPPAPLAVCACLIFFNLEPDFCIPLLTRGPLTSSLPSHVPLTGPKSTAPACPGVRREREGPHAIATTPASESIPCAICMAILFLRRRSAGRGVQIVRDVALWPIASILVCLPLRPALEAPSGRRQIHPYRSWKHAPAPTEISQNLLGALLRAPKRSIFGPPPPVGAPRGMLPRCVQKLQDSLIRVWVDSSTG